MLKKALRIPQLKSVATDLMADYQISIQRAYANILLYRSAWNYQEHRREDRPVRQRIKKCRDAGAVFFSADQLFDGRKFRALTLVVNFSRQCLAIRVGQSIKGADVVGVLEEL